MKLDWKKVSKCSGYRSLKRCVLFDCSDGVNYVYKKTGKMIPLCFNINGCFKKSEEVICSRRYCSIFKYVIDLAKKYSIKYNLEVDKILDIWEADRKYWYINYYQKYNIKHLIKLITDLCDKRDEP